MSIGLLRAFAGTDGSLASRRMGRWYSLKAMDVTPLAVGNVVTIAHTVKSPEEFVTTITENSPTGLRLEYLRSPPSPFLKKGEAVSIRFWEQGHILQWGAIILDMFGPRNESMIVSKPSGGVVQDRRKFPRYTLSVPLSFTVIHSTKAKFGAREVFDAVTQNVSMSGLDFESDVPLEGGEILEVELDLSPADHLGVMARVLRLDLAQSQGKSAHTVALRFLRSETEKEDRLGQFLQSG